MKRLLMVLIVLTLMFQIVPFMTGNAAIASSHNSNGESSQTASALNSDAHQDFPKEIYGYYVPDDTDGFDSLKQNSAYIKNLLSATYNINNLGDIVGDDPDELLNYSREKGIRTFAVIQNRENDAFSPELAERIISSDSIRETIIKKIYSLISEKGYVGVNIDFEGLDPVYKDVFSKFIQELVNKLRPEGFKVIVSIESIKSYSQESSKVYDLVQLGNMVDKIQIMTYDQHGPWSLPGAVASYQWVEDIVRYMVGRISSNKILLGLNSYAFDWNLEDDSKTKYLPLKKIHWLSSVTGGVHAWDPESQSPYFKYKGSNGDDHIVWYENGNSTQLKTQLVLKYNLAGVAAWRIGYEEQKFWESVMSGLDPKNQIDPITSNMVEYDNNNELLDDNEMNGNFPDAVHVLPGHSYQSYISISNDRDIYTFTAEAGGQLMVNLTSPKGNDYNVEVFETASWSNWLAGSKNGAGQTDTMTFNVKPDTGYYIVVYGKDSTEFGPDPYTLSFGEIQKDTYEPNGTFRQAVNVLPGDVYESYLSTFGDKDIYTFTANAEGQFTVILTSPVGSDYNVEVFETANWSNWLAGSKNGAGQTDTMTFTVKPDTAYYIVVYGKDSTEFGPDPYTLSIGHIQKDSYEPNGTLQQAVNVLPGDTYESYLSTSGDKDIYTFTADAQGQLTVNLTSPTGRDYDVEVFETANWSNWLAGSKNGAGQTDTMTFTVKPNTAYYIVVYGKSVSEFGADPYILKIGNKDSSNQDYLASGFKNMISPEVAQPHFKLSESSSI